ncbi:hypothetical protein THAPSDRAFT_268327 [Thalassiosira pseudonana CCMP1335]|uniref:tRNA pseudouridine synthase n=1 Tax=Thalassiosira pseudonana TaxID=35128 RepID=B8BV78_THAPS|nr:hypothetical protein THAPSDRAFT_268327 [Thalassiosira pseudonana CCMP1335]EED95412.1 hypothetical protein THAPSDRAFT_268327 [Thalassiosira pseudonana CCMP1335]
MAWNRPTRGYSSVPDVIVATIVVLLCIFGDPSHHPSASSAHVDAFIPISCEHQHRRRLRYTKQRQSILQTATEEAQVTLTDSSEDVRDNPANSILTTAVLKIAYDGTHLLAKVYGNVNPNQIVMDSCSRTDAGVHATHLVAQFYCYSTNLSNDMEVTSLSKLVFVLNRMLPPDVRVMAASPAPFAFHPTLHVRSKTYIYQFAIGPVHDPIRSQYVWHLDGSSGRAVGMNGSRFCLERDGGISFRPVDNFMSDSSNAINGLMESPQSFSVVITGDRFLYKMVRNIVGTIVAVGCGHLEVNDVQMALHTGKWGDNIGAVEEEESKSSDDFTSSHVKSNSTCIIRRICAPARGLSLHEVEYPPAIEFRWQTG